MRFYAINFVALLFGCASLVAGAEPEIRFNRDVRPILSDNCYPCHGFDAKKRKSGLRLDMADGAYGKAETGKIAIVPGDLKASELWRRINANNDDHMPPANSHKTLSAADKEVFRKWIEAGAKYEKHWAFVPPVRADRPDPKQNPIDYYVQKRLAAAGFKPAPPADKQTLLRRLSFDLTGLPPSIQEMDAFLADDKPGAYERQVDRLLASSRYGEQMAVRWLDVSRYGDTNGYLHDIRRTGWPWRDWVIKSFNDDKPFDQFVIEQLAGDLLPNATQEQVLATAFCRNHLITAEGGTIAAEYLNEYAADRVQTVATTFLGLTFNCCRCHNHKFDPIMQEDFYGMEAYFNSTTEQHVENNTAEAYAPLIDIASPLNPGGPKAKVMVMKEGKEPKATFVLSRGMYDQPIKDRPAKRRPPAVLGPPLAGEPENRLGLAKWIVSPADPLMARVTVNRLWQQVFGIGLVKSVDDFGVQGEYPTHPELLDELAVEFRDGAADGSAKPWSFRHIVRLIVTSETYRQSSKMRADVAAVDPDNRLLGRFPRMRLTAEQIRDQELFDSGLLNQEMGGAPVYPYQPPGLWKERSNEGSNTKVFKRSDGDALYRRSLYTFWKRTCPPPTMTIFDAPDRTACAALRAVTDTPLQALAEMNDEQVLECAKMLAARTLKEASTPRDRLTRLFRRATLRTPSAADLATLQSGLDALLARYKSAPNDAAELLKQGVTPAPADLDKSELAAWTLVASAVMNLDETLVKD